MTSPIAIQKAEIRKLAAERRRALDPAFRVEASGRIAAFVLAAPWFVAAREVSLYVGARDEVETRGIIEATLRLKGYFHAPSVEGPDACAMLRMAINFPDGFASGRFGLMEPLPAHYPLVSDPADMDVIFVPGLAFDRAGRRVGYGKGCYDRLLPNPAPPAPRPLRVGLAFAVQIFNELPEEPHDLRLDAIVTEDGVIRTGAAGASIPLV